MNTIVLNFVSSPFEASSSIEVKLVNNIMQDAPLRRGDLSVSPVTLIEIAYDSFSKLELGIHGVGVFPIVLTLGISLFLGPAYSMFVVPLFSCM